MIDSIELLDLMLEDQGRQPGIYGPGPYWQGYSERITEAIRKQGLSNFRSNSALGKGYADSVTLDPADLWHSQSWRSHLLKRFVNIPLIKEKLLGRYLHLIEVTFKQMEEYRNFYYDTKYGDWLDHIVNAYGLPDTHVGSPQDVLVIRGTRVSRIYLQQLIRIHNYSQKTDFNASKVVWEIGGGFGATAHLLLHMFPNIRKYLYLDIPPMLYVATQYLKHSFPSAVLDYRATRDLSSISFSDDDRREIICICPWQITRVEAKVDLFWNSASFQEMEINTLGNYADHVKRFTLSAQDAVLCLWIYDGGNPNRTLLSEQIIEPFVDCYTFEEITPSLTEESSSHYLLGRARG